jgi:hypothetical protein
MANSIIKFVFFSLSVTQSQDTTAATCVNCYQYLQLNTHKVTASVSYTTHFAFLTVKLQ